MGEVVDGNFSTSLDLSPESVLIGAINNGVKDVLVLGYDCDGQFYIASSTGYAPDLLMLVELARVELMAQAGH